MTQEGEAATGAADPLPPQWQWREGVLMLLGDWTLGDIPRGVDIIAGVSPPAGTALPVDLSALGDWDARLPALLLRLQRHSGPLQLRGAPPGLEDLLALATAVPLQQREADSRGGLFTAQQFKLALANVGDAMVDSSAFLGDVLRALARSCVRRTDARLQDLRDACFRSGPDALGIIALTSVLVGMILAYLGAEQLRQFGAAVYVADLVAIGMLREMAPLMTGVVMAGRTGAAYAAELSSMQGNEEIDAIRTLGIDPVEFLVLPRILGLCLSMPLLVVFADALGIGGGALVAGSMGVTPLQYLTQLSTALSVTHFFVGFGKALLFALLISLAGCRAGMQAGRSSEAVGRATTEAVVTAVVYLIVADAAVNILCQQLGV